MAEKKKPDVKVQAPQSTQKKTEQSKQDESVKPKSPVVTSVSASRPKVQAPPKPSMPTGKGVPSFSIKDLTSKKNESTENVDGVKEDVPVNNGALLKNEFKLCLFIIHNARFIIKKLTNQEIDIPFN